MFLCNIAVYQREEMGFKDFYRSDSLRHVAVRLFEMRELLVELPWDAEAKRNEVRPLTGLLFC